jgi:hypothetical protein
MLSSDHSGSRLVIGSLPISVGIAQVVTAKTDHFLSYSTKKCRAFAPQLFGKAVKMKNGFFNGHSLGND